MNLAGTYLMSSLALALSAPIAKAQSANPIVANVQTCTTSAAALPAGAFANGVVLTAESSNSGKVFVGGPTVTVSTGYPLAAGASISYGSTSLSMIYMICSNATDVLHYTGN
jgi:hypothetical protein